MVADYLTQLDQRKLEAKQALQREALVVRELHTTREYISVLEQRVRGRVNPIHVHPMRNSLKKQKSLYKVLTPSIKPSI